MPKLSDREVRDASRQGLQSAIAAVALYLGMESAELPEKFVGVLSAVLVIQPSVGSTLTEAWDRIASTLVGSAIGVLCLMWLPGRYGTAAALALSMLIMNAAAALRPGWRYGVVAAVALSMRSENGALETAEDRVIAIGLGALVGVIVSLIVWPDRASKRADRQLREALQAVSSRLKNAMSSVQGDEDTGDEQAQDRFHSHIEAARRAAEASHMSDGERQLDRTEKAIRLYNSVLIINRVGEQGRDTADAGEIAEHVEKIAEAGCSAIDALSRGERDDQSLRQVESALSELEDARSEAGESAQQRITRGALVFGLGELRDSLRDLFETYASSEDNENA